MAEDIKLTIVCMYTCHRCGVKKVPVTVPARAPGQDIVEYVKATADLLGADHERVSPDCPLRKLDIYMPLTGEVPGAPTRH